MSPTGSAQRTDLPGTLGAEYEGPDGSGHRPLGGYAALSGTFGTLFFGALLAARRSGRELPERLDGHDVVLAGVATHKLARLLAKDKVTSFIRAPFTRFEEFSGHGEVEEAARGRGLQLAVGQLLSCPYCLAQWIAGGFVVGHIYAPRLTRLLAAMWTAHALADAVQLGYGAAERRA